MTAQYRTLLNIFLVFLVVGSSFLIFFILNPLSFYANIISDSKTLSSRSEYTQVLQKNLWPCGQWQGVLLLVPNPGQVCEKVLNENSIGLVRVAIQFFLNYLNECRTLKHLFMISQSIFFFPFSTFHFTLSTESCLIRHQGV